ncbi:hypothetical protein HAX54_017758 [Datura stramonium]|uniref:Uncharacterized protein n=1 Tax=Datura stramonium TaxID=4076 RepID=A0ABS8UL56_DATST|nr:hypothetical protein [Datura stramonium]
MDDQCPLNIQAHLSQEPATAYTGGSDEVRRKSAEVVVHHGEVQRNNESQEVDHIWKEYQSMESLQNKIHRGDCHRQELQGQNVGEQAPRQEVIQRSKNTLEQPPNLATQEKQIVASNMDLLVKVQGAKTDEEVKEFTRIDRDEESTAQNFQNVARRDLSPRQIEKRKIWWKIEEKAKGKQYTYSRGTNKTHCI